MKRNYLIVLSPEHAAEGVRTYAAAVAASGQMKDRMPNARAWYAVRTPEGGWAFAPSKWCGYIGMTTKGYLEGTAARDMDGRVTEKRLGQWFVPLGENDDLHGELMSGLHQFLAQHGKQPNSAARISVIPEASIDAEPDSLVQLLIRVVQSLPPQQRHQVMKGLARN